MGKVTFISKSEFYHGGTDYEKSLRTLFSSYEDYVRKMNSIMTDPFQKNKEARINRLQAAYDKSQKELNLYKNYLANYSPSSEGDEVARTVKYSRLNFDNNVNFSLLTDARLDLRG